jgi:hypothetical protein
MANGYYNLRRYTRLRPRSWKPRKGAVSDPAYRAWIHEQPCLVHDGKCGRRAFEQRFGISFEAAIMGLNDEYESREEGVRGRNRRVSSPQATNSEVAVNF